MRIGLESEIAGASYSKPAQKRPDKDKRAEQDGAVEECFEIELGDRRQNPMPRQPLRCPEKRRSGERPEKDRGGEITEQSGCVLQAANVRFPPDAESTHMEGERRGRAETGS